MLEPVKQRQLDEARRNGNIEHTPHVSPLDHENDSLRIPLSDPYNTTGNLEAGLSGVLNRGTNAKDDRSRKRKEWRCR